MKHKQHSEGCDHTIHYVNNDRELTGSWTVELNVPDGRSKVLCMHCSKFYGYLSDDANPPETFLPKQHETKGTGASSLSRLPEDASERTDSDSGEMPDDTSETKPKQHRRPIDFAAVKAKVNILDVLALVDWQPTRRTGGQIRAPCIIHNGENPRSLSVNTDKNVFRCVKPACAAQGNVIDLWVLLSGIDNAGLAVLDLCDKLGIDVPRK